MTSNLVRLPRLLALLAWMALIFLLSANPNPYAGAAGLQGYGAGAPPLVSFLSNDLLGQLGHLGEYAVLGLLTGWALLPARATRRSALAAFGLGLLYALSDEIHQRFVPGRSFQALDLLVDGAGIAAGLWLYLRLERRPKKEGIV